MKLTEQTTLRNVVEWSHAPSKMPPPDSLLKATEKVPVAPTVLCASDYAPAIQVLRDKGYTWNEIKEWMAKQGADYSTQSIVSGWRTWSRRVKPPNFD